MEYGMEAMTADEGRETIREIMTAYDIHKEKWIAKFGSTDGYDAWFSKQTGGGKGK